MIISNSTIILKATLQLEEHKKKNTIREPNIALF
jgi:hypothetical protein